MNLDSTRVWDVRVFDQDVEVYKQLCIIPTLSTRSLTYNGKNRARHRVKQSTKGPFYALAVSYTGKAAQRVQRQPGQ